MTRPAQRKRNRPRGYRPLARKPGTLTRQEAAERTESRRHGPVIVRRAAVAAKPAPAPQLGGTDSPPPLNSCNLNSRMLRT